MAIEVQDKVIFIFSIGDYSDFIQENDLENFTIIEEAGNLLPTFRLSFATVHERVIPLLNEENMLKMQFGKDRQSLLDVPLYITSMSITHNATNKRFIVLTGLMQSIRYVVETHRYISPKLSAIEVMKLIASKTFVWEKNNLSKSLDSQVWIQPNITDKKFINELWMHAYLENSFVAIAITTDGYFIVKDIKEDLKVSPKWRFGIDIPYDADILFETNTAFINSWMGYNRENLIYDLESGVSEELSVTASPIMAHIKKLPSTSVEKRFGGSLIKTENHHQNYYKAYYQNLVNLAYLNSVRLTISYQNFYLPMRVLDRASFTNFNVETNEVSDFISGHYYITKIARNLTSRSFATTITLVRESLNQ